MLMSSQFLGARPRGSTQARSASRLSAPRAVVPKASKGLRRRTITKASQEVVPWWKVADSELSSEEPEGANRMNPATDERIGFTRKEMYSENPAGSVGKYDHHIFIVTGQGEKPGTWAPKLEKVEGPLANLKAAIEDVQSQLSGEVKVQLCCPSSEQDQEGDVLVFPENRRYRAGTLSPAACKEVVQAALLGQTAANVTSEPITGWNIFVCCHAKRDARCGVCGPELMTAFEAAARAPAFTGTKVNVRASSHVGGHKFAGIMILFTQGEKGDGYWYGYTTPGDAPRILESHIRDNRPVARLWRGQLGMDKEEHQAEAERQLALQGCVACGGCEPEEVTAEVKAPEMKPPKTAVPAAASSETAEFTWAETALAVSAAAALGVMIMTVTYIRLR